MNKIDIQRMDKRVGSCHGAMEHAIDPTACGLGFGLLIPFCSMTCCSTIDKDIYTMKIPARPHGPHHEITSAITVTCLSIDPFRLKDKIVQEVAMHRSAPNQSDASASVSVSVSYANTG